MSYFILLIVLLYFITYSLYVLITWLVMLNNFIEAVLVDIQRLNKLN